MGSIQQILTNLTTLFLKYAVISLGFNIFMKQVCLKGNLRNAIIFIILKKGTSTVHSQFELYRYTCFLNL